MHVLLQPAWILHTRAYRETSLIVDLLTQDHGRITLVANGVRGHKKSSSYALLQPFTAVLVSWSGKTSLYNLRQVEAQQKMSYTLVGRRLISGFYANELLMYLLHRDDPCYELYQRYTRLITQLAHNNRPYHAKLRYFEKNLLALLGYALNLTCERNEQGQMIKMDANYSFDPEMGFSRCQNRVGKPSFCGASLLALDQEILTTPKHLQDAKQLLRLALQYHLRGRVLKSPLLL